MILAFLTCVSALFGAAVYADNLVIISPHRKSIQKEYIPLFKIYYKNKFKKEVTVDWIDQGGTSDDVRFIRSKLKANPKTTGMDIFWGGGTTAFHDLEVEGAFEKFTLPKSLVKELPKQVGPGVPLYSKYWVASALSTFGIFYSNDALKSARIKNPPQTWEDLADPVYFGEISTTDPRRSGTYAEMNAIILQALGWQKGWDFLTKLAGNTRSFTHSSSDPIRAVATRDVSAAMAIDFYAYSKIAVAKGSKLGFSIPKGQTVISSDPIAVIKGAPNKLVADRFIEYVLSSGPQKLLLLPKGVPGGPKQSYLGRMAVNMKAYKETEGKRVNAYNPFKQKAFFPLDIEKTGRQNRVLNDLVGALLVDNHKDLKKAWKNIIKNKRDHKILSTMPLTAKQLDEFAEKWSDDVFRNSQINKWVKFSKEKYRKIIAMKNSH